MIIVRAKISNFSPTRLRNYLDQSVFLQGFLSFPPLIYLSVPAADCVFLEVPEGYDDIPIPDDCTSLEGTAGVMCDTTYYQCGAHLYSQFSICLLLSAFLGVRLFVAPLASASGLPSLGEIRVFDKLQLKIKFQIFLFSLVCICNIISTSSQNPALAGWGASSSSASRYSASASLRSPRASPSHWIIVIQ